MNSTDILCGELCSEFNREYGFFTSSISGASGILRGYVFSEFRKLSPIHDDALRDLTEMVRITDVIINSTINVINSSSYNIEKELRRTSNDYSFKSFLESININPSSFNAFNDLKDNVAIPIENYIKSLTVDFHSNLLIEHLSHLENSVPKQLVINIFNMKNKIHSMCSSSSLPSDSEIRTYMESVALNLNCEFEVYSHIIQKKFKFSARKVDYILNLLTIGRKLKTIKSKLIIGD